MGRVHFAVPDPEKPETIVDAVVQLQQLVLDGLSIGSPQNPNDDTDTTLAGSGSGTTLHNGTPGNFVGSWVEVEFDAIGDTETFSHYLNVDVEDTDQPNVTWRSVNFRHSGVGTVGAGIPDVTDSLSLEFDVTAAGNVTVDTIDLTLRGGTTGRTVAPGANSVAVRCYFEPAVRWAPSA